MGKNIMNRYKLRLLSFLLVTVSGLVLSGCGAHLYNKANHDLVKKVEENFNEVKIPEILKDERTRLDETLNRELEVVRHHTLARRDAHILATLVDDKTTDFKSNFERKIEARVKDLGGGKGGTIMDLSDRLDSKIIRQRNAKIAYEMEAQKKVDPKLVCDKPRPNQSKFSSKSTSIAFNKYCEFSDEIAEMEDELKTHDGSISTIIKDIQQIQANRTEYAKQLKAAENAFKEISDKIKEAKEEPSITELGKLSKQFDRLAGGYRLDDVSLNKLKELTDPKIPDDVLQKLGSLKDKDPMRKGELEKSVRKMIGEGVAGSSAEVIIEAIVENSSTVNPPLMIAAESLEKIGFGDLGLEGVLRQVEEKRAVVDDIIKAFIGGNPDSIAEDQDIKPSITIAANLGLIFKTANQPRLTALILQSEQLKIRGDELKKRIVNTEQRFALLKSKREALVVELGFLVEANKYLNEAESSNSCAPNLYDNFKPLNIGKPECAENLMRALVLYANSWSVGRIKQEEIDYRIIGLRHNGALDDSALALKQWNNLIGVSISQLSALHGAGVKPELIARWVHTVGNAAGLFYIGSEL